MIYAILNFFILKQFLRPSENHRLESWGPTASLDTKILKIDLCHILMSYASFDVIWCHMRHLMSNDAYDIKIWHNSILPILVSKEALGPQLYNLWVRFGLRIWYKMKKFKIADVIFFLYKFWKWHRKTLEIGET